MKVYGERPPTADDEEPLLTIRCARSDAQMPRCVEHPDAGVGIELRLPPGGTRHVAVWASWSFLPEDHGQPEDLGNLTAAWLFTLQA